jgi:hypothetical protein
LKQVAAIASVLALTGTAIANESGPRPGTADPARAEVNSASQLGTDLNTSNHPPAAVNGNSPAQLGSGVDSNSAAQMGSAAPGATVPNDSDVPPPADPELTLRSLTDTPIVTPPRSGSDAQPTRTAPESERRQ